LDARAIDSFKAARLSEASNVSFIRFEYGTFPSKYWPSFDRREERLLSHAIFRCRRKHKFDKLEVALSSDLLVATCCQMLIIHCIIK